ncbi:radical SAM/SPASM domain-containing protein [Helicobacter sp. MIT 99-5507]|uniref:radical SAM/SPASM domain-containing protein n=1 Tax=Helicobacter sp. MIT 99-5507 TaxID=152489 RepID=UPI000E1F42BF|nr:radical SAM/SPASM domain-containing protein [Helicobacter sp. MIT 99-5507]RDU58603.1 hypothetical protein CQA42_02135 [Helicobacter sp. MIT 99-5507]
MKAEFRQPYSKDRKPLIELLPLTQPITMYIDPSSICNFKCEFCFQSNRDALKSMNLSQMSLETLKIIITQLKEFKNPIKMIHLHGFGEPLLNKYFPQMVALLKDSNVAQRIATTSNASLLSNNLSNSIIEAGLDQIHFSIYGLEDSAYKTFSHRKISFSKIVENIKYFYQYKTQYADKTGHNCHIHIKMNKDYFSKDDCQRFLDIFGDYCDSIFLDGVANIWYGIDVSDSLKINLSKEKKEKSIITHQYGHKLSSTYNICPNIFYQLLIHSNGDVSPCCADYQGRIKLGNIYTHNLKDIWDDKTSTTPPLISKDYMNCA